MRQQISFEVIRQPPTACLSQGGRTLLYIAGHHLYSLNLESSTSAVQTIKSLTLPKPLEEQAHELKMAALDEESVCIWNSRWCVVKTLPQPGSPSPVDVLLDTELEITSVQQLTSSTLLCAGHSDDEAIVQAFDTHNGQLINCSLFPGIHSILGVASLPRATMDSYEEGLVIVSGSRSGENEPALFLYRVSVARERDNIQVQSDRIGFIPAATRSTSLMFERRKACEDDNNEGERYRVASLCEDGKLAIYEWVTSPKSQVPVSSGSDSPNTPVSKTSARCEQLTVIDNSLTCIKFYVWDIEKLILSSFDGIFYVDTGSKAKDMHLVKLSGSSTICGSNNVIYQITADQSVVYSTSQDGVVQMSICVFDDDDELLKTGSRKRKGDAKSKKSNPKKRKGSRNKNLSEGSSASTAANTEGGEAEDKARVKEIDEANKKRIQLIEQWNKIDLVNMSDAEFKTWSHNPTNTLGLQGLQKMRNISGTEASTVKVRKMAHAAVQKIKREMALRQEIAKQAKQPKQQSLKLSNLLASQQLEEVPKAPIEPIRTGKLKNDLVIGAAKCDEFGEDIPCPEDNSSATQAKVTASGFYSDDEDRLTDDVPSSTWKKDDDWDWKSDRERAQDNWSGGNSWWKNEEDSSSRWGGWKRNDSSSNWWNNRTKNNCSSDSWRGGDWSEKWNDWDWNKYHSDWGNKRNETRPADTDRKAAYVAQEMWQGPDGDWWFKCPSTGVWKREAGKGCHQPRKSFRKPKPESMVEETVESSVEHENTEGRQHSEENEADLTRHVEASSPMSPECISLNSPSPDVQPCKLRPASAKSNADEEVIYSEDEQDAEPYVISDDDPAEASGEQLASRVIAGDYLD